MKKWLLYVIITIFTITIPACALIKRENKAENMNVPPPTNSQITQQIQAASNPHSQTPTEKKLTQIIVKRGNDVFPFNPLTLKESGIILDVRDLLWVALRGGAGIQPEVKQVESKELDKDLKNGDKMKDVFCSVRLIYEPYRPKQGINDLAHKDLIIYINPDNVNDAYFGIQNPDNQTKWDLYYLPGYGQWLKKEVDLLLRLHTGL